jgi:hypothetical protein
MSAERTHIPGQLSVEELEKLAHVFASYNGGGYGGGGGYGEGDVADDAADEEGDDDAEEEGDDDAEEGEEEEGA